MPLLKPARAVAGEARAMLEDELKAILASLERRDGYWLLKAAPGLIGPSMVNDGCPIASALRIRLGGVVVARPSDVEDLAFGNAVHKAYVEAVKSWNPGWRVESGVRFQATVVHGGVQFTVGFEPDILMANGGEWHLVEVKSSRLRRSHQVQLALYWRLLRDEYNIAGSWLVTWDAVLYMSPRDLEPLARQGLEYLASVKAILDSWVDEPRLVIKATCPCRWAPACPIWRRYLNTMLGG